MLPHRFICRFASSKLGYKHRGMEERCWQRARCGGLRRHRHPPALLGGCRGTITLWPHQGTAEAPSPSGPVGGLRRHCHPPAPLGGCRGTITLRPHRGAAEAPSITLRPRQGAAEAPSPSSSIVGAAEVPSPSSPVGGLRRHRHPPAPSRPQSAPGAEERCPSAAVCRTKPIVCLRANRLSGTHHA